MTACLTRSDSSAPSNAGSSSPSGWYNELLTVEQTITVQVAGAGGVAVMVFAFTGLEPRYRCAATCAGENVTTAQVLHNAQIQC